ncbi:MAG: hypothetical protein KGO50_15985, partial [Myxococcales bacterium]|nr:hypothetical protein [Myxococcales bacterium]
DALTGALDEAFEPDVRTEAETRELLGDAAACADAECAAAAGLIVSAHLGVQAYVYAASEIYDMRVTLYDLNTGEVLGEEIYDCTFCPFDEARDGFAFTATTVASRVALPATRSSGPTEPVSVAVVDPPAESGNDQSDSSDEPPQAEEEAPEGEGDAEAQQADPEVDEAEVVEVEAVTPAPAFLPGDVQLRVDVQPESAEVFVNGLSIGRGSQTIAVAPQRLTITAQAGGRVPMERAITVAPDDSRLTVYADLAEVARGRSNDASANPVAFNQRSVGGILVGTGSALLIGGVVALAMDGNSSCAEGPISACASVYETTAIGSALAVVGGLAAGTGIGFFATAPANDVAAMASPRPSRIAFAPRRGGAVLTVGGRF